MNKKRFDNIISLKIKDLVSYIVENEKLDFESALEFLYLSKLMTKLTQESTKLWHLSSAKLYDILKTEKETNLIIYPDFV